MSIEYSMVYIILYIETVISLVYHQKHTTSISGVATKTKFS